MTDAVKVVMVTVSMVTLNWRAYEPRSPPPHTRRRRTSRSTSRQVVVASYDVEMTADDRNWTVVDSMSAVAGHREYGYVVDGLQAGTRYRFRVRIVWIDGGGKLVRSIPGRPSKWIRTHCGKYDDNTWNRETR